MRSVKFEVWTPKSAVCSVRCGVSREGHGRDRASLNYRSFMFGKLPPPACPGLCYLFVHCKFCLDVYLLKWEIKSTRSDGFRTFFVDAVKLPEAP